MAAVFGRDRSVIGRHLRNVFATGELERRLAGAKNAPTAADGKTYEVEFFNLDAILSVGYRVNSKRGTQFRIWATRTLREHLVRGFTLNERRLHETGLRDAQQSIALLVRTLGANALVTRIGALLFLEYLRRHDLLRLADGQPRLADTVTAALTLLIAESRPAQKDLMVRLVVSLLGDGPAPRTRAETVAESRPRFVGSP